MQHLLLWRLLLYSLLLLLLLSRYVLKDLKAAGAASCNCCLHLSPLQHTLEKEVETTTGRAVYEQSHNASLPAHSKAPVVRKRCNRSNSSVGII